MRWMISTLFLVGCATASGDALSPEAELAQELAGRTRGEPVDCIDASRSGALDIAGPDTLVSRSAGTIWVSRLSASCPGLRPMDQLIVEPSSAGRYCRNDRFRAVQPGSSIPGPYCRIGSFTPYRRR